MEIFCHPETSATRPKDLPAVGRHRRLHPLPILPLLCLFVGSFYAADPKESSTPGTPGTKPGPPPPLLLHEVWVPANALDPILARYPRAVSLGRDQLLTLLHDAADPAVADPATLPPERGVLRQARFDARLVSPSRLQVTGDLEVEVLSDQWAQVPLGLPGITLGTAEIDDGRPASLRRLPGKGSRPLVLLVQGRGTHRLRLGFVLPVAAGPESRAALPSVAGAGEFALRLPAGTRADGAGGCVVQPDGPGVVVRAALGANEKDPLRWRTPPPSSEAPAAILQSGTVDALVNEGAVTIRQEVALRAALGTLPAETRFPLPPEARAVRVEGTAARWDLGADGLRVALDPAAREAAFRVLYELPLTLDPGGTPAKTGVPLLEAVGAHRVAGEIAVRQGQGVQVRRVEPGALAAPAASAPPEAVAAVSLADLPAAAAPVTALTIEARRTRTRFSVDADARASFPPGLVSLVRNLSFHVEEGTLFTARVSLPKGETLSKLSPTPSADWRQEGDDLVLTWTGGISEKGTASVQLETQADFTPPTAGTPTPFRFRAVAVPGAERLTGYVAVDSTPALRVITTGGDDRLERRDARVTPVTGDVAWFYRDGFDLALRVERRATETEARFTGYALPLAGAVEIHGEIAYRFLHAGMDTVRVRVPADAADAFFFTGPDIAERRRDGDVWTIRFQGEQTGVYTLGLQATIPTPADRAEAGRFRFRLPTVAPLDTVRWAGVWAVEANTDTEIGFHAVGASEVDALHAPTLAGYQPRRRVIGVFEFLGGGAADAAIDLDGVRHPAAAVAAAVVDSLVLETFASTSGVARHRATLRVRTATDGFFNVRLPDGAALWSLTRDGTLVKPVGGAAGDLRVELPGGRDPAAASTVALIYETPGQPWNRSGDRTLAAPRFDAGVPVVKSRWTLHVPEGFDYRLADGALTQAASPAKPGDLLLPQIGGAFGHLAQWAYHYPQYRWRMAMRRDSGIADPAPVTRGLPEWMVEQLSRREAFPAAITALDIPSAIQAATPPPDAPVAGPMITEDDARRSGGGGRDAVSLEDIARTMSNIRIPNIEFRDTTLSDAIEFLRQESRRLDPNPDPERRGINLFLKFPAGSSPSSTRITLSLKNLPFLDALRYVAQQAGMKVKVEPYAVAIVPISEVTDALVTHEFKLSPGLSGANTFTGSASIGGGALAQSATTLNVGTLSLQGRDAKTFLEGNGVTFPPGASATFLPNSSKIVVRNTQENLDLIEALARENSPANLPESASRVTVTGSNIPGDKLATAEFSMPPSFLGTLGDIQTGRDITGAGSVTLQRQDAKSLLEAQGVVFPPGASATYLPGTGKLVVRNTPEALKQMAETLGRDKGVKGASGSGSGGGVGGTFGISSNAIDALLFDSAGKPALPGASSGAGVFTGQQFQADGRRENESRVTGRLPILLTLPDNGVTYDFAGGGEPGTLAFRYTDWRAAARSRWVWLTLGATAFLLGAAGWAHPWRRTLWVVLALTFWPLVIAPSTLTPCNALLAGWLWAVLGWAVSRVLLRQKRVAGLAVLCAAVWLPAAAHAAPKAAPTPTPAPAPETVIVPYDATKPAATQQPARYYLPYERFLALWDAAKRHRRPVAPEPPPGGERYSLNTARYDARLVGDTLEINAALDFQTFGEGWVNVPLRLDGALTLDGTPASLASGGVLWVGTPGAHRLASTLRLPAGTLAAGSEIAWNVPPTTATLVTFLLPRPDLRAEIRSDTGGSGVIEDIVPEGRRYLAAVGGATTLRLGFRDAPPPAQANGEPALTRIISRLVVAARQETVRSAISFPFPGRTQDHFTVYLDPGLTLTGLDAPDIKEWHLSTGGDRQTLDLTLATPARDSFALSLETDRPLPPTATRRRTFPAISARAGRVEQTAVLLTDATLEITLPDGPPRGARRTEWTARPEDGGRVFGAFQGDGSAGLVYSVDARPEKRAAHIDYLYQPGRGKIEWAASVRLSPEAGGAPIQNADLRLPPGAAVQAVAGGAVRQWWRDGDVLSLRFGPGEASFVVYLVQGLEAAPGTVVLPALGTPGFAETDGESVVAADRSFRVGLTLPTGARARDLAEIDPTKAAGEFQVKAPLERQRAFRYRNRFEVGATLEPLPALWAAQAVTRATVREGTIALEIRVNVEARQGALDAVEFSLPAGLPEAAISGPDVRETLPLPAPAGQDRQTYRVLWQNPVYGGSEAAFTLALEVPLGAGGKAALPDLRFPGARETAAFLLVENASSGEMTLDPRGLDPAVEKDVPFLPEQIVAGTRFFRVAPGVPWSLGVAVATLEKTAGRAALVAYVELTSTLRADGEEWHRAVYRLQNRRLQFLPVELPRGTDLIGARVAGESVRVDAGTGRTLLVPLLKTRPGELSYDVELVYRRPAPQTGGARSRRTWGRWQLDDPILPGIPVEKTLWDVFLPDDARLLDSGGNVEPVVAALNETEKLESALADLRSLSATYQSANATRQQQQLALNNFNSLAADVKKKTEGDNRRSGSQADAASAFFKQTDVLSQNGLVTRKQRSIQQEVDSLSTANVGAAQRGLPSGGEYFQDGPGRTYDVNGGLSLRGPTSTGDFDGFVNYGSPIQGFAGGGAVSGQGSQNWRDNRIINLDQNRSQAFDFKPQSATGTVANGKRQLALNDSVAVDLPTTPVPAKPAGAKKELADDSEGTENGRLSTARAAAGPAKAQTEATPAPGANVQPSMSAPAPAQPDVAKDEYAGAAKRAESLRSVGRVSLAVDFPQEGKIYHFKKLKSGAHLTLWSVRPAAFERLGWAAVWAVLMVVGVLVRTRFHKVRGSGAA